MNHDQIVELARQENGTNARGFDNGSKVTLGESSPNTVNQIQLHGLAIHTPSTPVITTSDPKHGTRPEDCNVRVENNLVAHHGCNPSALDTSPAMHRAALESSKKIMPARVIEDPVGFHRADPTDANDTRFFLHLNEAAFSRACNTPLPPCTPGEHTFLNEKSTRMENLEMEERRFHGGPLKVADGIAVLEESVEMHVPDVMTQF